MFCLFLAICFLMAGIENSSLPVQAATKPSLSSMVKALKAKKYTKAKKIAKKLPEKANEKCVRKMSSKMKKAYRKKVKSFRLFNVHSSNPHMWDFFLTDIDNDRKAELLVKYGTCEADVRMLVYKYNKGKIRKLGEFYCDHMSSICHYSNGILIESTHMGYQVIYQVYYKNGKLKTTTILSRNGYVNNYPNYLNIRLPYALKSHVVYSSGSYKLDLKDLT